MDYCTIKEGINTNHNESIIRQKQNSMCYYQYINYQFQIKKPNSFTEKLEEFRHQMTNPNYDQSNHNCMKLIEFFFSDEIKYLIEFKNLIVFTKKFNISLNDFKLFDWMKKQNLDKFEDYKKSIKILLTNMRYEENSSIFVQLCYQTSFSIKNNFIKL